MEFRWIKIPLIFFFNWNKCIIQPDTKTDS